MSQTLARQLAEYTVQLRFDDLPAPVVHEAKRRFIDSLGTAVGALPAEAYAIARRCALRVQGERSVGLIGGGRSSVEWATFVNGLLIRYLDFNDTYLSLEPAHPSDNLGAVLAVGELAGATGRELITAAVLAYEIQCRLCDAASLRKHGFDHVFYGALSSTAAACKLLRLDAERTTHALGLAGVCNVALRQTRAGELSMWKGCAFANAARNGVFAALLAAEGMTGPAPIFEGELGIMKLITGPFTLAPLGGGDRPFMINRTYIKFWPAEYHSQSAIDAALQLRPLIDDLRDITAIDIHTFDAAVDIIGKDPEKWRPRTRETADHSLPYCTAAALADGDVTLATFEERRFTDPELLALTAKVRVHRDAALSARYPNGIPNRLTITLRDGRQLVREVEFPRGHAHNPMSDAEVEQKFRRLVEPRCGPERASRMLTQLWGMEAAQTTDLMRLFAEA
ncbi:MAG: MmgE/PrpD family protein [Gemmataceae bacterium]|nr:MmgE/PrpD family protein [Gemmataceae bacterium]MDW8266010.1 MmgE/PrpD family protein [Gemmataceae bacterium]